MIGYIFDPEEKEFVEVERRYPFIPGPAGEPPLSPLAIYKRTRAGFSRQQNRATKEKGEKKELEKAARAAVEKALKGIEKEWNR